MLNAFAALALTAAFYFIVRGAELRLAPLAGGTLLAAGCATVSVFGIARRTAAPPPGSAVLVVIIPGFSE